MQQIENLQTKWESKTVDGWQTWRVVGVAVFFGLLILFGVAAGVLALLDRTPRLTATLTLLLWIWTGFVLILGTGKPHGLASEVHGNMREQHRDRCLTFKDLHERRAQALRTMEELSFGRGLAGAKGLGGVSG